MTSHAMLRTPGLTSRSQSTSNAKDRPLASRYIAGRLGAVALACLVSLPAAAGDTPEFDVAADGTVVGRIVVDAPAAQVRRAADAANRAPAGNVLDLTFKPAGDCEHVERKTRGIWSPLTMKTRWCPTEHGWRELLVNSDSYTTYESEWQIRDTTSGATEIQVRVRTAVNLAVPSSLVRQGTIDGMRNTFTKVLERLVAPRAAE